MRGLYSFGIFLMQLVIKLLSYFDDKLRLGTQGRSETFNILSRSIKSNESYFWFHCASLGEYEQGLPVFQALKEEYPEYKIVLSFFSPSGYEVKKDNSIGDIVVYLPLDSRSNAKKFITMIAPEIVVFVKYDLWPNYLLELKKQKIKAFLISALFRKNQSFFKWYGGIMKSGLLSFNHIFTQDQASVELLESINYKPATKTGDTRFDRVWNQLSQDNKIKFIEKFKGTSKIIIFGSSWPEDEAFFIPFINSNTLNNLKFIIAPHEFNDKDLARLKDTLKANVICYSELGPETDLRSNQVFVLDTIGYLSRAYSYADIAYVGGAAGKTGLHNILEPAVFGIPITIGPNFKKFPEAKDLQTLGGLTVVHNSEELERHFSELLSSPSKLKSQGSINKNYIAENKNSTLKILEIIKNNR